MTKNEFIQRAVLALMANPEPALNGFRSDSIDVERVLCAQEQWAALVRLGHTTDRK